MDATSYTLREATAADLPRIHAFCLAAVRDLGPQLYADDQVAAWLRGMADRDEFARHFDGGLALVACADGEPVALGLLRPLDHVALLYTDPAHGRLGLATALLRDLQTRARAAGVQRLTVTAGAFSLHLLARAGFQVDATETVTYQGARFTRWKMSMPLSSGESGA